MILTLLLLNCKKESLILKNKIESEKVGSNSFNMLKENILKSIIDYYKWLLEWVTDKGEKIFFINSTNISERKEFKDIRKYYKAIKKERKNNKKRFKYYNKY